LSPNEKTVYLKGVTKLARLPRKKSRTGVYHVMLRGIDKRNIFLHDKDKEKFLYYLFKAKELGGFELYGYCLMDNHVHILLKEGEELGKSIKRITVGYVQWHNRKYGRTGHLFQNRYKSEAVENDRYLIAVARYIHQNPVKAKMVEKVEKYKWSSYKDYIFSYNNESTETDTEFIMGYFGAQEDFQDYMKKPNDDEFLEYETNRNYTEEQLKNIVGSKMGPEDIAKLPKEERDRIIHDVYELTGASIRQLSRVTGIGRGIIQRAVKDAPNKIPL